MASTEVEEQSEPLKHNKTWVLRVSIHCKGCKRKVEKLLKSLPGVHDVDIETKQQRVVVKGVVSPETLIKKLVKAGKHAELWPDNAVDVPRNFNPPEINGQKTEKASSSEESAVHGKELKPPATKTEVPVQDSSKVSNTTVSGGDVPSGSGGDGGKVDEGVGKSEAAGRGGKVGVEVKVEEKKPETGSAGNQTSDQPVVEKKEEQDEKKDGVIGGGGGGGEGKKKKKKKGQNNNQNGIGQSSSSASPPVIGGSPNHNSGGSPSPTTLPSHQSPPRHHGYQYPPPHYYTPPAAPMYTVSYNTARHPVNSYTASYYAAPPPQSYAYSHFGSEMEPPPRQPPHSYAYSHFGSEMEPPPRQPLHSYADSHFGSEMGRPPRQPPYPPSDFDPYAHQPSDSFEMFSDENPNGCLIM